VVLTFQIWPLGHAVAQAGKTEQAAGTENEWRWPKTLQVCPAQAGDPVKLVKITKGREELLPGKYELPQIEGDDSQFWEAVKDWLSDVSFTLKSQTSKSIVSVGLAVVFPVRQTGVDCQFVIHNGRVLEPICDANPAWCNGGCPALVQKTFHWGLIPTQAATGLRARYNAEARGDRGDSDPVEGKELLRLEPGQEITLSPVGRVEGIGSITDPRHGFSDSINGILYRDGINEAKDEAPCAERANSKEGCAFAEVPKFNFGLTVVYFEGGTIWGNYGYGYAIPNPDGIFTRVNAHESPEPGELGDRNP
jgi:hypothetical protein